MPDWEKTLQNNSLERITQTLIPNTITKSQNHPILLEYIIPGPEIIRPCGNPSRDIRFMSGD